MKNNSIFVWMMSLVLLLSGCSTTESGAYTGAMFGSMIGSAIGGITGGWRGRDIGQLAGMAGGAIAGAAVGKSNEESRQREYANRRRENQRQQVIEQNMEQSDYDPMGGGDDRIFFDGGPNVNSNAELEIRHPQILDVSRDGVLSRGEEGRIVFEIYNPSSTPAYRIHPMVSEVTGNKHIRISENVYVESIQPHQGIRYTAMLKADRGLKDGEIVIRIAVRQGGREIPGQTQQLRLRTSRR